MACCIEINRKKDSRHRAIWRDAGISYSVPFLSQEEVADISVLDPVSAHVELIKGNNVLWEVVADAVIRAELTLNGLIGCQQIGNLNIQFFSTLVTYKVDLLVSGSADSHFVVPAQQLQIHDVL